MLDDGQERAAHQRSASPRSEIDGGGLRVTTTFTQKAMAAAEEGVHEAAARGLQRQEPARRRASVQPGTGALRGFYAGQDYLDSPRSTGRPPAAGRARRSSRSRWPPA